MIRLLIDENLSPKLVEKLAKKGVFAQHIAHIGLAARSDPEVWERAFRDDMAVVTTNARDFLMLAGSSDLHAGLIVLREGGLSSAEMWARVEPVVDRLIAEGDDLVNRLVEVDGVGDYRFRDLPPRG